MTNGETCVRRSTRFRKLDTALVKADLRTVVKVGHRACGWCASLFRKSYSKARFEAPACTTGGEEIVVIDVLDCILGNQVIPIVRCISV